MRELAGYELTVGRNGPKLRPTADPDAAPPRAGVAAPPWKVDADNFPILPQGLKAVRFNPINNGDMHVTGQDQSIGELIRDVIVLSLNDGKMVEDETGLTGRYDFKIDLALTGGFRRPNGPPLTADVIGPDIFAALRNDLGLELRKTRSPVEVLVIDQLEQTPADN